MHLVSSRLKCKVRGCVYAMAEMVNVRNVKLYKPRSSPHAKDFKSLFRFEEDNVQWLANTFLGESVEYRGGALTSLHKMKICLRYLSDPGYQKGIGEELGVDQSTVSRAVSSVVDSVIAQADKWIKFPTTENEIVEAKTLWQSKYRFPTMIGVVDCTHIGIEKPKVHGDEYVNRKGKTTLNIQATCDAREIFTSVDVSWPGSVHDARIWKNSLVRETVSRTQNTVIIADDGYGIEPWLMTPYNDPDDAANVAYNKLLTKERVIIERCFGQLKRRFPILKYVCRVKLENIPKIVVACVILHNIAKLLNDRDFEDLEEESVEDVNGPFTENIVEGVVAIRRAGQRVRNHLAVIINNF